MIRLSTGGLGLPQTITRGFSPLQLLYAQTFWEVLRRFLKSAPALTDLTDVYLRRTAPAPTLPYLVVTPLQGMPTLNNSETYWKTQDVQFSLVASDDYQAELLGQAAYRFLAPKQTNADGTITPRARLVAIDAYEMVALPGPDMLIEQPGRFAGNKNAWAYQFRYTFLLGKSMVA